MSNIDSINLNRLETGVDNLVVSGQQLQLEVSLLRKKLARATQERAILAEKNQQAVHKIKRILGKLKEELR